MNIPLLADKTHAVSRAYGVLKEDDGISFRGLFIIDGKSVLRQVRFYDGFKFRSGSWSATSSAWSCIKAFHAAMKSRVKGSFEVIRSCLRRYLRSSTERSV